ncbi:MAG: DegV family EDD domain-containing protein, partial [Firmicutes bacterium]|nr:DegV family EDD domain-containing protein [Bacillota bacterium]
PFYIEVGGETLIDDETLFLPELMSKMKACTGKMGSAIPSQEQWANAFVTAGGGFAVTISSKLSGMYQAAKIGLEMARDEVAGLIGHVFDSKSASCGEVLVALKIHQLQKSGMPFDIIVKMVEHFIGEMRTFFLLDDVSTLVKNGRMSKIKGTLVTVLGIKPILCDRDGEIDLSGQLRGAANVAPRLLDCITESKRDTDGNNLVIAHCNNPSLAEELRKKALERFHFARIIILETRGLSSLYASDKGIIFSF